MAAILEIRALNPISPYFRGGMGNIKRPWETTTAFEPFPMRKGSRGEFVG
jgi:hypothetical protein